MKRFNLSKVVGVAVLSLSLATVPLSLPASAQQSSPESNSPTLDTTPFQETKNDNNNWGWLGLLGLIGLANLFRKSKEPTAYSDPNASGTDPRY